jgi:hypothetical protein
MKMTFQSKEARDAKARELSAQGHRVSRRSVRGQVLSPNYVADYDLTNASRNMFGGYDTEYFPVLYMVETR